MLRRILRKIIGYPNFVRRLQEPVIRRLLDLKDHELLLDLGCGEGYYTVKFGEFCRMSVGVDIALNRNSYFVRNRGRKVEFMIANGYSLPFKDKSFDKILLSSVLQVVRDDRGLLMECRRVLKENGRVVISVPTEFVYVKRLNREKGRLKRLFGSEGKGFYRIDELVNLLEECGFEVEELDFSPKRLGSLIYEVWLYICYRLGLPLGSKYYIFLYPLAYLDRFDRKRKGRMIVVRARPKE